MSGQASTYWQEQVLNVLGGTAAAAPATVYLALFTVSPSAGSGGTEATGTGYARKSITANTTNFPAATNTSGTCSISNGVEIDMATAGGDWSSGANMVAFGLFDAATSGNLLFYGPLGTPAPVLSGNTPIFAAGALVIKAT